MAYRITSRVYNKKFWYLAVPKTGSQAVRELIEKLPEDQYVSHPSLLWHMTATDIAGTHGINKSFPKVKFFNDNSDAFFTTVRNPWARAVSFYFYQKQKLEERLVAYSNETEAKLFKEKFPFHVFDYDDKATKDGIERILECSFQTFEDWLNSVVESRPNRSCVINSLDDVDACLTSDKYKRLEGFAYLNTYDYFINHKSFSRLLVFTQENMGALLDWFGVAFDVPEDILKLNKINVQGIGDKYRDYYSSKMAKIIEEHESYIINMVGYRY